MKTFLILIFSLLLSFSLIAQVLYTQHDVQVFNTVMNEAKKAHLSDSSIGNIVLYVGNQLLTTPYAGGVLDKPEAENLVVDLSRLDCVTFLESVVALSITIKRNNTQFEDFYRELKFIRYRDGVMNGYASRLHYFSEWIHNNEQKGILEDLTIDIGGKPFVKKIHMMTTNRVNYLHLDDSNSLTAMKQVEDTLSSIQKFYIPKEDLLQVVNKINDGDLIAVTTAIDGLDVAHVGIAVHVNSELHLMHASSLNKKVEISKGSLFEMLRNKSSYTGIMVARLRISPVM